MDLESPSSSPSPVRPSTSKKSDPTPILESITVALPVPRDAHTGWEASNVPMAKCDFCDRRRRGTLQRCVTCRLSICLECCTDGRLEGESRHELYVNDVNWDAPNASRARRPTADERGRGRGRGRARRRGRTIRGSRARSVLTSGAAASPPPPPKAQLTSEMQEGYGLEDTIIVATKDECSPSVTVCSSRTAPEADIAEPPISTVANVQEAAPQVEQQMDASHRDQPAGTTYVVLSAWPAASESSCSYGYDPNAPRHPHTSSNPPSPYETTRQTFIDPLPWASPYSRDHRAYMQSSLNNYQGPSVQGSFSQSGSSEAPGSYQSLPTHHGANSLSFILNPEQESGINGIMVMDNQSGEASTRREVPPINQESSTRRLTRSTLYTLEPTANGDQPDWYRHDFAPVQYSSSSSSQRPVQLPLQAPASLQPPHPAQYPPSDTSVTRPRIPQQQGLAIQGLAASLQSDTLATKKDYPHWPLDECLRHEINRAWLRGSDIRQLVTSTDEGNAFRILLSATYTAAIRLELKPQNAAREWLCEREEELAGRGVMEPLRVTAGRTGVLLLSGR